MDWSIGLAGRDVPDPYYGDAAEFDAALDLIEKGCEGLVRRI
jgi:protein-tyrosine phosphatase